MENNKINAEREATNVRLNDEINNKKGLRNKRIGFKRSSATKKKKKKRQKKIFQIKIRQN